MNHEDRRRRPRGSPGGAEDRAGREPVSGQPGRSGWGPPSSAGEPDAEPPESLAWYRELYERAPVPYLAADGYGLIESANVAAEEFLGVERRWLLGRPLVAYAAEGNRKALLDHLRRCRTEVGPIVTELWLAPRHREPRYVQLISQRAEGATLGPFRVTLVDQTDRHRAERAEGRRRAELEELAGSLERRTEELRALAAQLSRAEQRERRRLAKLVHDELQQFLVGARMRAEALTRADPSTLPGGAEELTRTLDSAIEASRSLSRELSPRVAYEADLASALDWLAGHMGERLGLTIHLEAHPAADVEGGELRAFLLDAVSELLLNVAKHAGTSEAWVRSRMGRDRTVELEVEDRGAGFDPEALEGAGASTGLGLYGMQARLSWLGGGMEVRARSGEGVRVTIRMPPAAGGPEASDREVSDTNPRPGDAADASTEPETNPIGRRRASESTPPPASLAGGPATSRATQEAAPARAARRIEVLIADDSVAVRRSLAHLIHGRCGCVVVGEATDGRDAVEKAEALSPDAVIMDVHMPGGNGIEATARIGRAMPGVRVIGFTVLSEPDINEAMLAAGAEAVFPKSTDSDRLIHQLQHGPGSSAASGSPSDDPAGEPPLHGDGRRAPDRRGQGTAPGHRIGRR